MMDSTADDEDFPPNPFRSGGQQAQQQQQQMLPPQQQQQQPQMQAEQQDFFSNPAPTMDPLSTPSPMDSSLNMNNMKQNNIPHQQQQFQQGNVTVNERGSMQAPAPKSWWQTCRACCTMQTYQQFFDIDTVDIKTRILSSITHFYQPDYFRTKVIGSERTDELKGPDLYGPFWVTMTLVFLVAVTSNIAAYLHSDNMDEFEYDIMHLIRALTILSTWAFAIPTLFWVTTQCMSMHALGLVDWVCLYGYGMVPYVPATLLCLIPVELVIWISLGIATGVSAVLILRNVAGPLLASDVSQSKSGPLLLAILGSHVILLLTLKLAFYK